LFDARTNSDLIIKNQKVTLGLSACLCVCIVLAFAIFLSAQNDNTQTKVSNYQQRLTEADNGIIPMAMPDLKLLSFESSYLELSETAHHRLEAKLKQSNDQTQAINITFSDAQALIRANSALLAKADVRYVDAMLALTRNGLNSAITINSPYCQGIHYKTLGHAPYRFRNALTIATSFASQVPKMGQYSADMATLMLQAAANARTITTHHGSLTNIDKATIEGVLVSLEDDPHLKQILQAFQSGHSLAPSLKNMDACKTGVAAITALSTLPQDTKARLWAHMLKSVPNQPK